MHFSLGAASTCCGSSEPSHGVRVDDDASSNNATPALDPTRNHGLESYQLTKTEWVPGQSPGEIVGFTKS